ncbi:MAG: glycosyltransferase family 4 protein [Ignavibacteriaceae bacterium]|nr:glycosyltransferase family 4 protein [Ignavibacteriaceae bacterium]
MKIAFYIKPSNLKAGGIFTYSIGILKLLISSNEITQIYLVHSGDQREYFEEYFSGKVIPVLVDRADRMTGISYSISFFLYDIYTIYKDYLNNPGYLGFLKDLSNLFNPYLRKLKKLNIDLLHVPVQFSPVYEAHFPVVTTMHDLQEFHYPEFFPAAERLHRAVNCKKAIYKSNHVIVSFAHIKNDVLKYFEIEPSRVSICPPPFAEEWFSKKSFTLKDELIKKYSLLDNFILYPAATWRHKNHAALIEAVALLRDKGVDASLICTGNKTEHYSLLQKQVDDLNLTEHVKFLGIVDEEDLIGLYKIAGAVVIPTLYEAGSGPMYEAMRYGTPVLASNVTSLPESMGDNRFIFDPKNVEEMRQLIEKLLTDKNFRNDNLKNSQQRIEFFKTQDYAKNFIEVYKTVLNK